MHVITMPSCSNSNKYTFQIQVLIDGPCSGIPRQQYRIKNLHLTPLVTKFPFSSRTSVVRKAWESDKISEKWSESSWAKRMEMKTRRAGLNDFDRWVCKQFLINSGIWIKTNIPI